MNMHAYRCRDRLSSVEGVFSRGVTTYMKSIHKSVLCAMYSVPARLRDSCVGSRHGHRCLPVAYPRESEGKFVGPEEAKSILSSLGGVILLSSQSEIIQIYREVCTYIAVGTYGAYMYMGTCVGTRVRVDVRRCLHQVRGHAFMNAQDVQDREGSTRRKEKKVKSFRS